MTHIRVHEQVPVHATFGPLGITPRALQVAGRTLWVETIHQRWHGRHGAVALHYVLVTAGGQRYRLCLNGQDATWMAEALSP
jgi:hypothetical protein